VQKELEEKGHSVEIPEGVKRPELRSRTKVNSIEKAEDKIKYNLIRDYYEKIKHHDVVLIVNPNKNSIPGYIGGNTLIEMAFAHVLNKKLFCLYSLPEMTYSSELIAMEPIILDGNLGKIA
jgi:hypothetical protein